MEHVAHKKCLANTWATHIELIATAMHLLSCAHIIIMLMINGGKLTSHIDKEDELFTPRSHIKLLYYCNLHYDCIVNCTTQQLQCSTTKPNIQS